MNSERTLSIIKPDATKKNISGKIFSIFEENNLKILAQKRIILSKEQAEKFYDIHRDRPFFNDLVEYMCSGVISVQVLEGLDAVKKNRNLMGSTNPLEADKGTIRALYGDSIQENAVHGSDSVENAKIEIDFFFSGLEIIQS